MNSDGYPDEEELATIAKWPYDNLPALMEYIKRRWQYSDCGYWKQRGTMYRISTGGWSGNESIISAMQENTMFWLLCWVSSRRGGHYTFNVDTLRR